MNTHLLQKLDQRFEKHHSLRGTLLFLWKKYAYISTIIIAKVIKRIFDICLSIFFLISFLPLFFLIAILIKCTDWGPVLYVSRRIGKNGKEFSFYKFRSMHVNADRVKETLLLHNKHKESITFKLDKDPRVTWVGRILRKTSLDELPQLWNVIKGDMSLVGPRPALVEEVMRYSLEERKRLDTMPGITGLWQVSGRADLNFIKQCELDMSYIKSENVFSDILILLKTIPAVIFGKGAY